eukprot:g24433.t1
MAKKLQELMGRRKESKQPLSTLLLACFQLLLHRLTRQGGIIIDFQGEGPAYPVLAQFPESSLSLEQLLEQ